MDTAWRYPVIVQVISRNGHDVFFGVAPDFGIETFEVVDPGNLTQEYMFHLKLRRLIGESLSVHKAEQKELPVIRHASSLTYPAPDSGNIENSGTPEMLTTSRAASMLGVHPETIRRLFDAGALAGVLTAGRQRLISVKAISNEKEKMAGRVEMRKLEQRAKKVNSKRQAKRIAAVRKKTLKYLEEEISNLTIK